MINKTDLGEKGQSTVEFALTMILFMTFFLFYFQLCMVFAFGNYVHYATFMSARAYLAAGSEPEDQRNRAKSVIVDMLKQSRGRAGADKFASIGKGIGGDSPAGFQVDPPKEYKETIEDYSWMQGVRYTFKSRLFMIPLAGMVKAGGGASGNSVILTSESWLGHEPSFEDCKSVMDQNGWIYDNGC